MELTRILFVWGICTQYNLTDKTIRDRERVIGRKKTVLRRKC